MLTSTTGVPALYHAERREASLIRGCLIGRDSEARDPSQRLPETSFDLVHAMLARPEKKITNSLTLDSGESSMCTQSQTTYSNRVIAHADQPLILRPSARPATATRYADRHVI